MKKKEWDFSTVMALCIVLALIFSVVFWEVYKVFFTCATDGTIIWNFNTIISFIVLIVCFIPSVLTTFFIAYQSLKIYCEDVLLELGKIY